MSRKDWGYFVNHPDTIALISSTGGITTKSSSNTGLWGKFKATYSPADSFKKSIKRDAGLFTTIKKGKYWDTCHRNTLAPVRVQDTKEVLNSNYRAATSDDVNIFKEK